MPFLGAIPAIAGALGATIPAGVSTAIGLLGSGLGLAEGIANKDPLSIITSLIPVGGDIANGVKGLGEAASLGSDALGTAASATSGAADAAGAIGNTASALSDTAGALGSAANTGGALASGLGQGFGETLHAASAAKPAFELADLSSKLGSDAGYAGALNANLPGLVPSSMPDLGMETASNALSMGPPDISKFHLGGVPGLAAKSTGSGGALGHLGDVIGGLTGATQGVLSIVNAFKKPNLPTGKMTLGDISASLPSTLGANTRDLPNAPNGGYPSGNIQAPQENMYNLPANQTLLKLLHAYSV